MTNTTLTPEQIEKLFRESDDLYAFCNAIEQAVLQSPEVQEWRRDAERYRATRAGLVGTDPDYGSRFCEYCDEMGIKQAENITEEQFDAATDAAMEKQP